MQQLERSFHHEEARYGVSHSLVRQASQGLQLADGPSYAPPSLQAAADATASVGITTGCSMSALQSRRPAEPAAWGVGEGQLVTRGAAGAAERGGNRQLYASQMWLPEALADACSRDFYHAWAWTVAWTF